MTSFSVSEKPLILELGPLEGLEIITSHCNKHPWAGSCLLNTFPHLKEQSFSYKWLMSSLGQGVYTWDICSARKQGSSETIGVMATKRIWNLRFPLGKAGKVWLCQSFWHLWKYDQPDFVCLQIIALGSAQCHRVSFLVNKTKQKGKKERKKEKKKEETFS